MLGPKRPGAGTWESFGSESFFGLGLNFYIGRSRKILIFSLPLSKDEARIAGYMVELRTAATVFIANWTPSSE